ncbi:uncharacterized protein LOC114745199 [Neltuma alba]|uniref:uncharacterized protein LOC114745199 n=1 Tax=Neltuma alba TaxID=207710 RepID=UPI0010A41106|nr:uncharacterized protein LOC114745199 [Prosopis alba]
MLKSLEVSNCGKLANIFQSDMQGTFGSLETLKVSHCSSVEEIFELTVKEIRNEEETTTQQVSQLKKLHLFHLPKLKQIWSKDAQESLRFHNLQLVWVEDCENLEYLFPFSIAMHATQLESISIKYAWNLKYIVSGEGPMDSPVKFALNQLTSVVFWSLFQLEGFFAGNHSLLHPLLREIDIRQCWKLKLFKTESSSGKEEVFHSKHQISLQQPLFALEEVLCNLEMLALNNEDASMILQGQFSRKHFNKLKSLRLANFEDDHANFPYWFLQNITTVDDLLVELSSFREIFKEEISTDDKGKSKSGARLKTLSLCHLDDLQHICTEGFRIDPVLEVLEYLQVFDCSSLKHLAPSSATFHHLTYLEVENCNGLLHLITSSTARSLVKLTTMKITKCNSLEQVVAEEREGPDDEIAFSSLEFLELESLPMIKRFCSSDCYLNFPLLKEVVIKQCPRMDTFSAGRDTSTPNLRKISSKEEDGNVYWESDLNKTINNMFADKVAFRSFNLLEFSVYPELKELWYGQDGPNIFCNLKHLVVRKCTFLSNVIFSSNLLRLLYALEELEVSECDSLEVVFDVNALDEKAKESKEVSRLKKLTLSGLPNLKCIWNGEAGEIISFENLQMVKVDKCQHLKCLFSVSLCQDLRRLEELHIESCGAEEIVSIAEGLEELKFDFPQLTTLNLLNLTQLTNFYPKRCILECPLLKWLNVRGCEELQIFAFDHLNSQPLMEGDNESQIEQALFHIEKVSQNLKELPLNEKDTMRILNGNYEKNLFQSIKRLRLQYFQGTPIKFLNDLIQIFPAITRYKCVAVLLKHFFIQKKLIIVVLKAPPKLKRCGYFNWRSLSIYGMMTTQHHIPSSKP